MASSSSWHRAMVLILAVSLCFAASGLIGAQLKVPALSVGLKDDTTVSAKTASNLTNVVHGIEGHNESTNESNETMLSVDETLPVPTQNLTQSMINDTASSNTTRRRQPSSTNGTVSPKATARVPETVVNLTTQQLLVNDWSRAFPVWNHSVPHSWCHAEESGKVAGILFVKVNKCASSTGMGVALRIADTLSQRVLVPRNVTMTPCFTRYRHGFASTKDRMYQHRNKERSVLWSILRHPAPRVMSAYFFYEASRNGKNATEEAILNFAQNPDFQTHYVNYLRMGEMATREMEIQNLLREYDFIGVSERMDESIVVLAMILKLPLADLVVLSSKQAGGYDDGRSNKGCVKLKKKWSTPAIDEYLNGDFLANNSDYLLYQSVNASLDKTIQALGMERVAAGVERYRMLSKKNDVACRDHAIFPCPALPGENIKNRTRYSQQDCYFSDAGCGHKCTDRALRADAEEEWKRLQLPGFS